MIELDEEKVKAFSYAVKNNYWYQMYIDDLPIWGRVGERSDDKKYSIYTHKKFEIGYNGQRIVDVKLTTDNKQQLVPGAKLKITYEVSWYPSTVEFKDRFNKYLDPTFFQHRVIISLHFYLLAYGLMLPVNSDFNHHLLLFLFIFRGTDPLVQHL